MALSLSIRCGELPPFTVEVPPDATVAAVKYALSLHPPLSSHPGVHAARLIYGGRLLDPAQRCADLGMVDGSAVHVVLGPAAASAAAPAPAPLPPLPFGAPFAPPGAGGDPPPGAPRGFGRLALVGLDEDNIAVLRALFLPEVLRDVAPLLPRAPGETEASRVLRLEDAWLSAQGDDSDLAANLAPLLGARGGGMAGLRAALGLAAPQGGGGGGAGAVRLPPWIFHPSVCVGRAVHAWLLLSACKERPPPPHSSLCTHAHKHTRAHAPAGRRR